MVVTSICCLMLYYYSQLLLYFTMFFCGGCLFFVCIYDGFICFCTYVKFSCLQTNHGGMVSHLAHILYTRVPLSRMHSFMVSTGDSHHSSSRFVISANRWMYEVSGNQQLASHRFKLGNITALAFQHRCIPEAHKWGAGRRARLGHDLDWYL